jgi:hypothetical protein
MTNRNMVKPGQGPLPEPNRSPPTPVPRPESDPPGFTTEDPLDSPQPKPMIRQDKDGGTKTPPHPKTS